MPRKIAAAVFVLLSLKALPCGADDDLDIDLLKYDSDLYGMRYGIFFEANKDGATTCTLETTSDPGGSACPFGPEPGDLSSLIFLDLSCAELEAEIETAGTDWTLVWDEGLGTETVVDIDFGSIDCTSDWPADFPTITNPPDDMWGVPINTSIDWAWPASPVLNRVGVMLFGPGGDVRDSGDLPHPPPPTSWTPASPLTPGEWTSVVRNEDGGIRTVPDGLTITGDLWDISGGWLDATSLDVASFSVGCGSNVIRITDNSAWDAYPDISGSNVVWQECDGGTGWDCAGGDYEIYFWDGVTTTRLTDNSTNDEYPAVSGSKVVWAGCDGGTGIDCDGGDYEIYLWNGVTTTQLTDNSTDDQGPDISGANVVWEHSWKIYLWDGVSTTNISDSSTGGAEPAISGSNVVWRGSDGGDQVIYFWDGATYTEIGNTGLLDQQPAISGSNVVWLGDDGNDREVYFWDGVTATQLTYNSTLDVWPDISGSNVVWQGCEGGTGDNCDGGDFEIYLWDGDTITNITDNSHDEGDPAISGSNVVFYGGGDEDLEILMKSILNPVPSISSGGLALVGGLVFAIGVGGLAVQRRRRAARPERRQASRAA